MKKYRRLDWSDRLRIETMYNTGNSCLAKVTQQQCDKVAASINAMPRKMLNWQSAADLFAQEITNIQKSPQVDL